MMMRLCLAVMLMSLTTLAQAMCMAGLFGCAVDFQDPPTISGLSTSNCTSPYSANYTVINNRDVAVNISYTLNDNDDLGADAVTIDSVDSTCPQGGPLGGGDTCTIVLSFQPCTPGDMDRDLVLSASGQLNVTETIETTVAAGDPPAYIVNYGSNTITLCDLTTEVGSCTTPSITTGPGAALDGPAFIVLATVESGTYAYISNFAWGESPYIGTTVTICEVNPADYTLGTVDNPCQYSTGNDSSDTATFSNPNGLSVDSVNNILYVVNGGVGGFQSVSACPIDPSTGLLEACVVSNDVGSGPNSIAINPAGTLAYVTDYFDNAVSICDLDPETGVLSDCTEDSAGGNLSSPDAIELSTDGTMAYISSDGDYSNTCNDYPSVTNGPSITSCQIDPTSGAFINCSNPPFTAGCTSDYSTLGAPAGLTILYGYLFISNNNLVGESGSEQYSVTACPINEDGSLNDSCALYTGDSNFNVPNDIFILGGGE